MIWIFVWKKLSFFDWFLMKWIDLDDLSSLIMYIFDCQFEYKLEFFWNKLNLCSSIRFYKRTKQSNSLITISCIIRQLVQKKNMANQVFILCSVLLLFGSFVESRSTHKQHKYEFMSFNYLLEIKRTRKFKHTKHT